MATHSMRIRVRDLLLLVPGTKVLVRAVAAVRSEPGAQQRTRGAYHRSCHEAVLALSLRLQAAVQDANPGRRFRMALDCFGFSAALLAARISRRLCAAAGERLALDHLIVKLDRHRIRAKRVFLRGRGSAAYEEEREHWRTFVRWVRECMATERLCARGYMRGVQDRSFPGYNKRNIELAIQSARKARAAVERPVPSEGELRRLVRCAIRAIRRGRAPVAVKDLILGTPEGLDFLEGFIARGFRTVAAPGCDEKIDSASRSSTYQEEV